MRRIIFVLAGVVTLSGVVAYMAPASEHADDEAAAIEGGKLPPGYRDWRLISVAHEEGDLNDIRGRFGQRRGDQSLPGREASAAGRRDHCPAGLEIRSVGGKQQNVWPPPIFRGRAPGARGSVYGQGLKKIRRDGRLEIRSIRRRQTARRGDAQELLSLSQARQRSRLRLHSLRTIRRRIVERHSTFDIKLHAGTPLLFKLTRCHR